MRFKAIDKLSDIGYHTINMTINTLSIRPRRQATFPKSILSELGVGVGDTLEIEVDGGRAVITPRKKIALDALEEIQKIFKESGISEEEMTSDIR